MWQSFRTPQTAAAEAVFTLGNYAAAYGSGDTLSLFLTSVQFASGTAIFAFAIGATLAWMNERTNTPFKTLFFALSLIPLVIPSILFTVAWILLASPQIGIINLVLQGWLGLEEPLFDVYSLPGMIWVDGLHYSPMAFLLMTAAFRAMDPSLEESATMSGAGHVSGAAARHVEADVAGHRRHHPDPVRPGHRVVRGAGAAGAAVGHRGVHVRRSTRRCTAIRARSASRRRTRSRFS